MADHDDAWRWWRRRRPLTEPSRGQRTLERGQKPIDGIGVADEEVEVVRLSVDGAAKDERATAGEGTCRWQLRNSDGTIRDSGFIESGARTPQGRRLTWTEQLTTHTESKLMEDLQGVARPGDIISIQGTRPPCNPGGRGCQNVMAEFAEQNGVTIIYTQVGDGTWRWP